MSRSIGRFHAIRIATNMTHAAMIVFVSTSQYFITGETHETDLE